MNLRRVDLRPTIFELGKRVGRDWEELARSRLLDEPSLVWPRFMVWLLRKLNPHVGIARRQRREQVIALYLRVIRGERPGHSDWSSVRNLDTARFMPLFGCELTPAEYIEGHWYDSGYWASNLLLHTIDETSGYRDVDWLTTATRILLYLQLEYPSRDETEASLQQAVVADESILPVYCDCLEEHDDPVANWLRLVDRID